MKRGITLIALALLTLGLTTMEASAQSQREYDTVRGWYERFLGREPEPEGWRNWATALTQQSPNEVLAGILASGEYYERQGGTPDRFISGLYSDLLGRQPAEHEVRSWLRRLAIERGDRAQIAREFLAGANVELATRPLPGVTPVPLPVQPPSYTTPPPRPVPPPYRSWPF
jgi:hypothetical protein